MSSLDNIITVSNCQTAQYRQIADTLRYKIREGIYTPGAQIPTEAELLQQFGVSRITVRRALQDLVGEGVVVGQKGRGTFVNTSPYAAALNILFVHALESPITYPYTHLLMEGINQYSRASHLFRTELLPLAEIAQQSPDDTSIEDVVNYGHIDGVITIPRLRPEVTDRLAKRGIPLIVVGNYCERQVQNNITSLARIGSGPEYALDIAIQHLKQIDKTRIGVIGNDLANSQIAKSKVQQAFHRLHMTFDSDCYEVAGWGINPGKSATLQLLSRRPDLNAIVASDDMQALGVLQALSELGKKPGGEKEQVGVVGMGNLLGSHSHSGLTTIDVNIAEQGLLAARTLHRLVDHKPVKQISLISPRLIRRQTT